MGLRPARAMGAEGTACRLGGKGSPKVAGARAGWDSGAPRGPGGVGCWAVEPRTQQNEEGRRGGGSRKAGVHLWVRLRGSPGSRRGLPGRADGTGKDTHKFLGFAAVASCRRHLVRAPALLLIPGPTAGPQAPAGRLHIQVRASW